MRLDKAVRRYKLILLHIEYVKKGEYEIARLILRLLRKGAISLGLRDNEWTVEMLCEDIGCPIYYERRGYRVRVHI